MTDTPHSEIEDLLAAYALDAVDSEERALVDAHLDECARCRAEVAEHRDTAALLAYSGADAPAGLWDGISSKLERPDAPVISLRPPAVSTHRREQPRWLVAVAAASAIVLGAVGALGWKVVDQDREFDRLAGRVAQDDLAALASSVLADPRTRQIELKGADGRRMALVALTPDGDGYVLPSGMQTLELGRAYQLWALAGDAPVSAGLLGRSPDVSAFHIEGPVEGFAISVEDADGAAAPTSAPVAAGTV
ncbi:MAG: anti-sigma factor domain-containing protein [Acidimicrobiia bacterium]